MANVTAMIGFIVWMVICLIVLGTALADYILMSFGLYKVACKRQIPNPWMAWIPFASDWIIGSLAGDYDEKRGCKRNWNTTLLSLSLGSVALGVVMEIVVWIVIYVFFFGAAIMVETTVTSEESVAVAFIILIMCMLVPLMVVAVIETGAKLCRTMCLFKIYESSVPKKALKYTILYYMIPLAGGICLLKCKDYVAPVLETESGQYEEGYYGQ